MKHGRLVKIEHHADGVHLQSRLHCMERQTRPKLGQQLLYRHATDDAKGCSGIKTVSAQHPQGSQLRDTLPMWHGPFHKEMGFP